MYDLALMNGVLCDGHSKYNANIFITGEKIEAITPSTTKYPAVRFIDCSGKIVVPGFIDPHVHLGLNLGKYISDDDFSSGSEAAIAGGVTTLFDFVDPVSKMADAQGALSERLEFASRSKIDYGLHFTLAGNPDFTPEEISRFALENGIPSIKIFTTYSSSGRRTSDGYLYSLLKASGKLGTIVMAHCENDELIDYSQKQFIKPTFRELPELRPTISETEAVIRAVFMSMNAGGQLYVVHVSSGATVDFLSEQPRDWRKNAALETCPQYLIMGDDALNYNNGYLYTFCPPLRPESEMRLLCGLLRNEWISTIGTDHCPFKIAEKEENKDDYLSMPNGIPGLGYTFSIINTVTRNLPLLVRLMSENPAKLMGIYPEKGSLLPGTDADIAVIDPDEEWIIGKPLWGNAEYSTYSGMKLIGRVKTTILRGEIAFDKDEVLLPDGNGRFIKRKPIHWG